MKERGLWMLGTLLYESDAIERRKRFARRVRMLIGAIVVVIAGWLVWSFGGAS